MKGGGRMHRARARPMIGSTRNCDHAHADSYPRCNAAERGCRSGDWPGGRAGPRGRERGGAMLKDVVVTLSGRAPRDFAADYAPSIAAAFGARIAGVSFLYEPVIPDGTLGGIPVDLIEL